MSKSKHIWIITLFPELLRPFFENGIAGSAFRGERGPQFEIHLLNMRDFSATNYKGVDDSPYGGGAGMVMRADVLKAALFQGVIEAGGYVGQWQEKLKVIMPSPRGVSWSQKVCQEFSTDYLSADSPFDLVFICGRYEGIDERFIQRYVNMEISIGDYVLTGGEIATMAILDSAIRFVPGALGNAQSCLEESFQEFLLEQPQYTRPREFEGMAVPQALLSGHHLEMARFQLAERERVTKERRPDLYQNYLKQQESSKK